ncbi:MAG TPA: EAL domain-containing protein [Pyrinomonadaceae bacterium]|nr:EAL domain-containing protein [Pyrinomonadaceae bacterium]
MSKQSFHRFYLRFIPALGAAVLLYCVYRLPLAQLDLRFLLLAAITICFGSRLGIEFSKHKVQITVSDSFVFLTLLLYGTEPAVVLAAAEAFCSSFRFARLWLTRVFNAGLLAISTFVTSGVVAHFFGPVAELRHAPLSGSFVAAVCLISFVQFAVNTGIPALRQSLKLDLPFLQVWREHYLWISVTYFAGASAAAIIARLIHGEGFYALLGIVPVVAIIYFTYQTYRKQLQATLTQAEQARRHAEEQRAISQQLRQSEEQFRSSFDNAAVGMALVATDGRWVEVNPSLCALLGYAEGELVATNIQSVLHPEELGEHLTQVYRLTQGGGVSYTKEMRLLHREGRTLWAQLSASLVRDPEGRPLRLVYQVQDVTERRRAEEQLHHAAYHDSLTGLANRTLFAEHLRLAVERARRHDEHLFAVLFMDLDRFKNVNDSLGHAHGDRLLLTVAARLKDCVRPEDTVARFGGDEFAILLNGIRHATDAVRAAERIQEEIGLPFALGHHEIFTSASVGITLSALGYAEADEMLRDADTAMYRAKSRGKGRYEVFDKVMHARAVTTLRLENELRRAVEDGEFRLHYQPIVKTETGRVAGFEALIRWEHPERGLVPPGEFIPAAEETDLIIPMGEWVLGEACRQARAWQREFPSEEPLFISVNLSGKQFTQRDLVEVVERALRESGLEARCLKLEITETAVMENAEAATAMLRRLRDLGVQLGIDDFGTGYSSLSYLHRFPVNTLKVDRSFVGRMDEASEYREIVRTIVSLAHTLCMEVVAEGVETRSQCASLAALRCEYSQGYFFSKPLPAAAAAEYLMNNRQQDAPPEAEATGALDLAESYPM